MRQLFAAILFAVLLPSFAIAETVLNPESHHSQYQSYGLFFDPQSMLILRSGGRGWGAIGGSLAFLEFSNYEWKPQLVLHASANVGYEFSGHAGGTLYTQTVDARVGFSLDLAFSESFRGAVIWTHQSGHIADNVPDRDLIGPDLGNEMIDFRLIKDIGHNWRYGGGFRPFVLSNPVLPFFGAEQFLEWFPFGASENVHKWMPFAAFGLEEYGWGNLDVSAHAQIGWVAGNHFVEKDHQTIRLALGYYNGMDPRLKYFQFKHRKDNFLYAGFVLEM